MNYKKLIITAVVKKLCKRAGKIAAKAVIAETSGHTRDAERLKVRAEKLEYAAKVYSDGSDDSSSSSEKAQMPPSADILAAMQGKKSAGKPTGKPSQIEYSLADVCEALRDQLPREDSRPEAQATCLAALGCINDKNYVEATESLLRFAWGNGVASGTASILAGILQNYAATMTRPFNKGES